MVERAKTFWMAGPSGDSLSRFQTFGTTPPIEWLHRYQQMMTRVYSA